jgi:hypothetical protein
MRTISKAPRFFGVRRGGLRSAALRSGALSARQEMLGDDLASGVLAAAAAGAHRELALHFKQRARAMVDGIANLTVTYCIADANVHLSPSSTQAAGAALMRMNAIPNKNDCQLH